MRIEPPPTVSGARASPPDRGRGGLAGAEGVVLVRSPFLVVTRLNGEAICSGGDVHG
jgi:hypothetical protein